MHYIKHRNYKSLVMAAVILLGGLAGSCAASGVETLMLGNAINEISANKEKIKDIKYVMLKNESLGFVKNIDAADLSVAVESGADINQRIYTAIYSCDQPKSRNGRATLNCYDINDEMIYIECDATCREKLLKAAEIDANDQPWFILIGRIVDNYGSHPIVTVE